MPHRASDGRTLVEDVMWLLAFVGGGAASRAVTLRGPREPIRLRGHRLPALCPFLLVTGRRCPSCGMTRGVLYMFRLDLRHSLRANLLAPLAFLLLTLAAARSGFRLLGEPRRSSGYEHDDEDRGGHGADRVRLGTLVSP
jgi:hypothetical protein